MHNEGRGIHDYQKLYPINETRFSTKGNSNTNLSKDDSKSNVVLIRMNMCKNGGVSHLLLAIIKTGSLNW